ncbi:hypothetical protein GCM10011506_04080 [Marivirga lumbricoides]|uniref:Outer membrane protein beta-barrel domain-containing protein n=1 Tax=Marivirga lumbricoides TaxID=1046115 RepID=A0A2T4DSG9_9BACT|nr:hypothetical protein C9994_05830 [Marivirga lumbricoides]GGC22000.1 hypothetical protein GCM10011506_04080 [Marivirga lumbricoides]
MKKTIFLLGLLIPFSFSTFAQMDDDADKESKVGIRGSFNLTNWYEDELDDKNLKAGFGVGIFYRGFVSDNFSIQPEIGFTQKGSTFEYDVLWADGEVRGILNYVELPVLFNIHPTDFLHIGAGPYVATLISAKAKAVDDDGDSFEGEESFDRDNFQTFDWGFAIDAGLDFDNVSVGARYGLGLQNVEWDTDLAEGDLGKNSALQIYIGFMF